MVLPTDITAIKVEKEDFEHETIVDACDIEVKVEKVQSPQIDWCVENNIFFENFQECYGQKSAVVHYEELKKYGLQICRICKRMFQDIYSLLCHKLIHLELRLMPIKLNHRCNYCLKYFEDKIRLRHHIEHKCQSDVYLNQHDSEGRKADPLQQCHICCKVFNYKIWFEHMKHVHSNQYYQCEICNRKFKAKKYLKRHIMSVHEGKQRISFLHKTKQQGKANIELFKCDQCPAVFPHKTPLHLHKKNCHCEKVRCEKCLSLLKKSYLANHMRRVHYDDGKEHKCDCGKKFRSPRYLKIHIKNAHSKPKTVREKTKRKKCNLPVLEGSSDSSLENIKVKSGEIKVESVEIKVEII